jgi:hypothetical protein
VPALPPYLIEPIWQQVSALLPERKVDHPLGVPPSSYTRPSGLGEALTPTAIFRPATRESRSGASETSSEEVSLRWSW